MSSLHQLPQFTKDNYWIFLERLGKILKLTNQNNLNDTSSFYSIIYHIDKYNLFNQNEYDHYQSINCSNLMDNNITNNTTIATITTTNISNANTVNNAISLNNNNTTNMVMMNNNSKTIPEMNNRNNVISICSNSQQQHHPQQQNSDCNQKNHPHEDDQHQYDNNLEQQQQQQLNQNQQYKTVQNEQHQQIQQPLQNQDINTIQDSNKVTTKPINERTNCSSIGDMNKEIASDDLSDFLKSSDDDDDKKTDFKEMKTECIKTELLKENELAKVGIESDKMIVEPCKVVDEASKVANESTSKMVVESSKTSGESSKTSGESTKAIEEPSKALRESSKMVIETSKPIGETLKTVGDSFKTREESSKPISELVKPVGELSKAIEPSSKGPESLKRIKPESEPLDTTIDNKPIIKKEETKKHKSEKTTSALTQKIKQSNPENKSSTVDNKPSHPGGKPSNLDGKSSHSEGKPSNLDSKQPQPDSNTNPNKDTITANKHQQPAVSAKPHHKAAITTTAAVDGDIKKTNSKGNTTKTDEAMTIHKSTDKTIQKVSCNDTKAPVNLRRKRSQIVLTPTSDYSDKKEDTNSKKKQENSQNKQETTQNKQENSQNKQINKDKLPAIKLEEETLKDGSTSAGGASSNSNTGAGAKPKTKKIKVDSGEPSSIKSHNEIFQQTNPSKTQHPAKQPKTDKSSDKKPAIDAIKTPENPKESKLHLEKNPSKSQNIAGIMPKPLDKIQAKVEHCKLEQNNKVNESIKSQTPPQSLPKDPTVSNLPRKSSDDINFESIFNSPGDINPINKDTEGREEDGKSAGVNAMKNGIVNDSHETIEQPPPSLQKPEEIIQKMEVEVQNIEEGQILPQIVNGIAAGVSVNIGAAGGTANGGVGVGASNASGASAGGNQEDFLIKKKPRNDQNKSPTRSHEKKGQDGLHKSLKSIMNECVDIIDEVDFFHFRCKDLKKNFKKVTTNKQKDESFEKISLQTKKISEKLKSVEDKLSSLLGGPGVSIHIRLLICICQKIRIIITYQKNTLKFDSIISKLSTNNPKDLHHDTDGNTNKTGNSNDLSTTLITVDSKEDLNNTSTMMINTNKIIISGLEIYNTWKDITRKYNKAYAEFRNIDNLDDELYDLIHKLDILDLNPLESLYEDIHEALEHYQMIMRFYHNHEMDIVQ